MDISAFRYSARFDALHEQVMALPEVARLHALCCADHVRAIAEKAGKRAEDDPRYVAFLAQAAGFAAAPPQSVEPQATEPEQPGSD